MNIVFFGSGAFGLPTLERLAQRHTITAVITQPDRPAGRGGKPAATPIGGWAARHLGGVDLLKPERIKDHIGVVRAFDADAWVVIAFGQKLPPALLDQRFAVNLHASLLPRWRGAAPINAAVLAGDNETGNSVIALAERMDAGAVYARSRRAIDPRQTAGELHDLLAADGPAVVERVLDDFAAGTAQPAEQDESLVTLAPKLSKADGWVDFASTAAECLRRVHGLTPWPGVAVTHRDARLRLHRVVEAPPGVDLEAEHGAIVDAGDGIVRCGDRTALRLLEVQPAGGKLMPWRDYANGRRVEAGEILRSGGAV